MLIVYQIYLIYNGAKKYLVSHQLYKFSHFHNCRLNKFVFPQLLSLTVEVYLR